MILDVGTDVYNREVGDYYVVFTNEDARGGEVTFTS